MTATTGPVVIDAGDLSRLGKILDRADSGLPLDTVAVYVSRRTLRTALAAVLPHTGDLMDRVRLHLVDGSTAVAIASSGYTVAAARIEVRDIALMPELGVIDIEPRSAREVLAVLVPPKDKDARFQWLDEAFKITATHDEVTFSEESDLLGEGRSLTVPRLPHIDDDGQPTFPDLAATLARMLRLPLVAPGTTDVGVGSALLTAWVKSAAVVDCQLDLSPRDGRSLDGEPRPGPIVVSAGQDVIGVLTPRIHPADFVDDRPAWWAGILDRVSTDGGDL